MLMVRSPEQAAQLSDGDIKQRMLADISRLLADFPGSYDPAQLGWFVIVERPDDLNGAVYPDAAFTVRQVMLAQHYDWLGQCGDHYEMVWVVDGCEAITIYLPKNILSADAAILAFLHTHAIPNA
jgi:hypothetical protein